MTPEMLARWLAPGAMDGMGPELTDVLRVLINTWARPSEIVSLRPDCIRLDHPVPHIRVESGGGYMTKSASSERSLPLVGVSLDAMARWPEGFARYRDDSDGVSAAANKSLRARGLLPSTGVTIYGLRHGGADRARASGVPPEIREALLGHKTVDVQYGEGYSLDVLRNALEAASAERAMKIS